MTKPKVLIAEHNPLVRKQVKKALSRDDLEVYEVTSGAYLIDEARAIKPNLIILETRLPGHGGRDIFKAIKGEDGLRSIPVILLGEEPGNTDLSQYSDDTNERNMAFHVIPKPIDSDILRQSVFKALELGAIDISHPPAGEVKLGSAQDKLPFPDHDFTKFQDFLMSKIGMFFDIKRKKDMARALDRRIKAIGLSSYREYFDYLTSSAFEEKELKNLILHLTIGETTFFRSPDQFVALQEHILPEIMKREEDNFHPQLNIWSSGCSTGEEPYSLAITLEKIIPNLDSWDVTIHATDINQKFLKFAERGVYPARKVKYVSSDVLTKYFTQDGENYVINPRLKKYIKFSFHNISDDNYYLFSNSDVIFCRNVLIYFKRDRIREVIDKFKNSLRKNGYLMLGYSETLFQISDDFTNIHYKDAFFYRLASPSEKREHKKYEERLEKGWYSSVKHVDPVPATMHIEPKVTEVKNPIPANQISPKPKPPPEQPSPVMLKKEEVASPPIISILSNSPVRVSEHALPASDPNEIMLWNKGMEHYFNEGFSEAEEIFEQIAQQYKSSPRSLLGRAFIYANAGKDEEAKFTIERVNGINDLLPESYYLRGLLKEKDGDIEGAMADYRNVILLDPDFAMAHFNLAIIYMKLERMRDSRREFANTLEILKRYETDKQVRFSGGLHREALIQLCEDLE